MNSDTPQTNEELIDAAHCAECGYEVVLADAMRKLERELAEARERNAVLQSQVENADTNLDQVRLSLLSAYRKDTSQLNEKLLALSVAYQRQKDALKKGAETFKRYAVMHLAKGTPEGERKAQSNLEMARLFEQALAETPDGSLLERVIALAQMAESESEFTINKLGHRVSTGGLVQLRNEARSLLSTLQLDHQK